MFSFLFFLYTTSLLHFHGVLTSLCICAVICNHHLHSPDILLLPHLALNKSSWAIRSAKCCSAKWRMVVQRELQELEDMQEEVEVPPVAVVQQAHSVDNKQNLRRVVASDARGEMNVCGNSFAFLLHNI